MNRHEPPLTHGPRVDMAQLQALRPWAERLPRTQPQAHATLAGGYRSRFRGRGMEFEEVRAYQPGDDVRTIDWKVTARSGVPHTKVYCEERERPVLVVAEQTPPLAFGSRLAFKSVTVAGIAAALAWAALGRGDRVGGMVYGDGWHRDIKPRRQARSVLHWLQHLADANQALQPGALDQPQCLARALDTLRPLAKPGTTVWLVADLASFGEEVRPGLHALARHCDVRIIAVYDPLECELPPPGQYRITAGGPSVLLDTRNEAQRQHFHQQFDTLRESTLARLHSVGASISMVANGEAWWPVITAASLGRSRGR